MVQLHCWLQRRAAAEETKVALAMQQHGYLQQAQTQYLEMMSRGVAGGVQGERSQ